MLLFSQSVISDCSHQAPLSMGFSRQGGSLSLLQGIFPTQGLNLSLLRLAISNSIPISNSKC